MLEGVRRPLLGYAGPQRLSPERRRTYPVPYEKLTDLPDNVRDNLPKHAQEIYQAAYNSAEEQYDEEDRRHRVAWSAVKEKYEKDEESGEWVPKEED
jgi:cation transport regulator